MNRYLKESIPYYKWMLRISIPTMLQNGVTNFVSMLDNIMVGQVGTLEMTGVSIVNQLLFVFNLCIFGANAGAGIFTAQFHGNDDAVGVRLLHQLGGIVGLEPLDLLCPERKGALDLAKKYIKNGASPRAAQALITSAKVRALMHGRYNVAYEDIVALAVPVLRHRIKVNYTAINDGLNTDDVIERLLRELKK